MTDVPYCHGVEYPETDLPPPLNLVISQTYSIVRVQGRYSETGSHIGMDRNFVCLCADTIAIDLSLCAAASFSQHLISSSST